MGKAVAGADGHVTRQLQRAINGQPNTVLTYTRALLILMMLLGGKEVGWATGSARIRKGCGGAEGTEIGGPMALTVAVVV